VSETEQQAKGAAFLVWAVTEGNLSDEGFAYDPMEEHWVRWLHEDDIGLIKELLMAGVTITAVRIASGEQKRE